MYQIIQPLFVWYILYLSLVKTYDNVEAVEVKMKVIKRNGSEVDFDVEKIIVAITKANNANVSHELSDSQIKEAEDYSTYKC